MKVKNAFRVHTLFQVSTIVLILSAFGFLAVGFYKAAIALILLAGIVTFFGVRQVKRLYYRCTRIEQGYGDPDGA